MIRTSLQVPDDILNHLKKEVEKGNFNSIAEGLRFYLRRGYEVMIHSSKVR